MALFQAAVRSWTRRMIVRQCDAILQRYAYDRTSITLQDGRLSFPDYHYHPQPRFGAGKPPIAWLGSRLQEQSGRLAASMADCLTVTDDLARIRLSELDPSPEPRWLNPWLSGLDGVWLYSLVRSRAPGLYLEIGSGNSTKFVRRAIKDGGLRTRVLSIDPHPRAEIDALCDGVHRSPLEETDPFVFDALAPGDVLFFDGSHRAVQNSDVTVFFLEILPRLAQGVFVGVHDIFLPFDYPAEWTDRVYNEQYMLAAYLLGRSDITMDFAAFWMSKTAEFQPQIEEVFRFDTERRIPRRGAAFFFVN